MSARIRARVNVGKLVTEYAGKSRSDTFAAYNDAIDLAHGVLAAERRANRCCALDLDGNRCRRPAVVSREYHGDSEIREVQWHYVQVQLCAMHDLKPKKRKP